MSTLQTFSKDHLEQILNSDTEHVLPPSDELEDLAYKSWAEKLNWDASDNNHGPDLANQVVTRYIAQNGFDYVPQDAIDKVDPQTLKNLIEHCEEYDLSTPEDSELGALLARVEKALAAAGNGLLSDAGQDIHAQRTTLDSVLNMNGPS